MNPGQPGGSIREFAAVRCNLMTLLGFAAFCVLTPTSTAFSQESIGTVRDTSETAISNSQSGGRRFDPGAVHQSSQRLRTTFEGAVVSAGAAPGQQAANSSPKTLYTAAQAAGQRIDPFPVPSATPTPFRDFKGAFWTDVAVAVAGNGMDLATTELWLVRCGECIETFPLGQTRGRRIAIKALSVSARAWASYSLRRRGHKNAATVVRWIWFTVDVGVSAHNVHIGSR